MDPTLVVVERRQVRGQQLDEFRHPQVVDRVRGDPLEPAHNVVPQVADHPGRQRRQAHDLVGPQQLEGPSEGVQRITAGRRAGGDAAPPRRLAGLVDRQRGRRATADERPP